jgi:hypothetical protein
MMPTDSDGCFSKIVILFLFAVAIGYFEAAVVVYLRALLYPDGFSFPLRDISTRLIVIELFREAATIVILVTVAALSGRRFWERFGFFLIIFGAWDIFYYVWLKATIDWPLTILDWDVLFLIPAPWLAPVVAPMSIAILMIAIGISVTGLFRKGYNFRPTSVTWALAVSGTIMILYSFMRDYGAMYNKQLPRPYLYGFLVAGLLLYVAGYLISYKKTIETR